MTETVPPDARRSAVIERNVAAILKLDQQTLDEQSLTDRWFSAIGRFTGSAVFIILQVLGCALWLLVNRAGSRWAFDPFPHSWLMLVMAFEAILVSAFVLISQQQMQRRDDRRAHVNLQFNLLVEAEITKVLSMLQALRRERGGSDDDEELRDLATRTEVQQVVQALEDQRAAPVEAGGV